MSKSKSQAFESVRRQIARRLQAGLPLAGMIAATTLLCGCNERPPRGPIGKMQAKDDSRCEQKSEQPKPKTPPTPNQKNKTDRPPTPGRTAKTPPQRQK